MSDRLGQDKFCKECQTIFYDQWLFILHDPLSAHCIAFAFLKSYSTSPFKNILHKLVLLKWPLLPLKQFIKSACIVIVHLYVNIWYCYSLVLLQSSETELVLVVDECELNQIEDGFRLKKSPLYWYEL